MKRLAHVLLALAFLGILGCVAAAAVFYAFILRDLPEINTLRDYRPNLITRIRAVDGSEIASFAKERRVVVSIEDIPHHVVHAFIAAEDSSFYEHEGLDYAGILRAAITNLRAGKVRQGGSTITQQVAKTFLLSSDRSYVRKLKDMVLAMRIERALNKNEILYLYLNQIYLGSGAYGIEAAAHTYFAKSASELTLAESALIAGLVPAPSKYTPRNSSEKAFKRQRFVLRRMEEDGFISAAERAAALTRRLEFHEPERGETTVAAAYFVEEVRRYLVQRYGSDTVFTGGLEVRTTLDPERQRDAYHSVRTGLRAHDRRTGYRGPIRNVPRNEWAELLAQLGAENEQRPRSNAELWRALVMQVDNDAEDVRLAVGPRRETVLTLEDLKWARVPDTSLDGIIPRVRHVSQALHVGDLVWLEKVGERPGEVDSTPVTADSADQLLGDLFDGLQPAEPDPEPIPIFELYQEPLAEGSLVSLDLETKYLLAMIGGYDFGRSQFNRALQSRRQPGSAFKAIIYAAALEQGYTPATIVYDTPIVYVDADSGFQWKPENYSDKFYGPIPLRQALAKSRNIATIKILREIGLGPVHEMAERLGIRSPLEANLGLALGNSEVTLGELTRAYTTFATGGRRIDPIFIVEIRDRDGVLLEEDVPLLASLEDLEGEDGEFELKEEEPLEEQDELERVMGAIREVVLRDERPAPLPPGYRLDPVTAYLMTDMLRAVIEEGTGRRVRALRRPVAGKTGTTNNLFDAWFIGYTPQIATGVWVGYDNARDLGKIETGSRAASPIFLDYMQRALKDLRVEDFSVPEGVVFARIDLATGLLAKPGDEKASFQPFREGTTPESVSSGGLETGSSGRPPRLD